MELEVKEQNRRTLKPYTLVYDLKFLFHKSGALLKVTGDAAGEGCGSVLGLRLQPKLLKQGLTAFLDGPRADSHKECFGAEERCSMISDSKSPASHQPHSKKRLKMRGTCFASIRSGLLVALIAG